MLPLSSPSTCRVVTLYPRGAELHAELVIPADAQGLVVVGYPTGNGRANPTHQHLVGVLHGAGMATLLCDLLTEEEEMLASVTGDYRDDVGLLANRLIAITDWCLAQPELRDLRIGVLGVGSATPAAFIAAAAHPDSICAIVGRGGRLDRAWSSLRSVAAPVLLAVGERDQAQRAALDVAFPMIQGEKQMLVVPRAGPLFAEPSAQDVFAEHAGQWFATHLPEAATRELEADLC